LAVKEGEFVNLDYTGKVNGKIFDLTDEKLAKENGVYEDNKKYGPVTIVVGAGHLIKGVDEALVGKESDAKFEIEVEPEKGFGKKDPKLLKIMPEKIFKDQQVRPVPGMNVNIDGILGRIVSCSGGRAVVDFNHPLAGKVLEYDIKINRKIDEADEQLKGLVDIYSGMNSKDYTVEILDKKGKVSLNAGNKLSDNVKKFIIEDSKKYMGLEGVEFVESGSGKATEAASEAESRAKQNDL